MFDKSYNKPFIEEMKDTIIEKNEIIDNMKHQTLNHCHHICAYSQILIKKVNKNDRLSKDEKNELIFAIEILEKSSKMLMDKTTNL